MICCAFSRTTIYIIYSMHYKAKNSLNYKTEVYQFNPLSRVSRVPRKKEEQPAKFAATVDAK